jgi:hypothetical protein
MKSNYYFTHYGNREAYIFDKYLKKILNNNDSIFKVEKDNTSFHDLKVLINSNYYTIEVKEDEFYWFNKTGNIGIDYISAFNYKNGIDLKLINNNWVKKEAINEFKNSITIHRLGKLFTSDADFQFFFVEKNNEFFFSKLYSTKKLQSKDFVSYLERNYDLRINNKSNYQIDEKWESAAFFINPLTDSYLIQCETKVGDVIL